MITKKKIRKVYAPLTLNVNTEVTGALEQVYESMFQRWTPDRTAKGAALKIQPRVYVTTDAQDNTWSNGDYTSMLDSVEWYVNDKKIADSPLVGCFSIDRSKGANNGCLTITKNLSPAEQYDLVMRATLTDTRSNTNVQIQTDAVHIGVSEITADEWDLSVVHDVNIKYYPLLDKLKEYDWKVANNIISASETERKKALDGHQYLLRLPVIISRGSYVLEEDSPYYNECDINLYVVQNKDGNYNHIKVSPSTCIFLKSISKKELELDLRFIPDGTILMLELSVNNIVMGTEYLSYSFAINEFTCEPTNEGDIDTSARYRYDKASCTVMGTPMQYPEAYLDINWFTNSYNASNVPQGSGENIMIDMTKASLGTAENCWLEVYIVSKVKAFCAAISQDDEGNAIVVDDNNNAIVITDVLLG